MFPNIVIVILCNNHEGGSCKHFLVTVFGCGGVWRQTKYSPFLFVAVMFYQVTVNNESANTELLLLGNREIASFQALVTTFSSISEYITLFYVCFHSKTPYLI